VAVNPLAGVGEKEVSLPPEPLRPKAKEEVVQIKERGKEREVANISKEGLENIAESLNKIMKVFNAEVRFSTHQPTGETIFRIYDRQAKRIIREVPSVKMLDIITYMIGLLVDERK